MTEPARAPRDDVVRPLPLRPGVPLAGEPTGGARSALSSVTPEAPPDTAEGAPKLGWAERRRITEAARLAVGASPHAPKFGETARRRASAAARFAAGESLWHATPPSLAAIHAHHKQGALRHDGAVPRYARMAWGWLDLALTALSYGAGWVRRSFVMTVLAALLIAAVIMWR